MSVGTRRGSHQGAEDFSKITLTAETHLLTDLGNREFFVHQQVLCFRNSETREI